MRKLGLISTLWAGLLLFPLTGNALGLGDIEASSFLNQPLKAEIDVISARPGEIDDLLISLASRDAFAKAGLERPAGLSKLRFKVEKSEDGTSAKILVSTKTPVVEPFLSFLVEADWAKGRLLREFTVLLDPPSFAQQAVKVAPEQATRSLPEPTRAELPETVTEVEPQSAPTMSQPIAMRTESSSTQESAPYVADDEYPDSSPSVEQIVVAKGDTLWGISSQFKDENHSMAQVMLAMQMMNPDAFSQDNINNLKVGAVLRVPDMDVMDKLSKQEAYAQVLDQNGLWDEYVARKSGTTSTAVTDSSNAIESTLDEAESQLSLLTADDGESDSASLQNDANSENAGQIRKQLALAEEELEAARLENDDLKSRISMLEEQQSKFEELQRLVQVEDDSLAQLQQNMSEEDDLVEETAEVVEEAMAEMAEPTTDEMIDELASGEEKPSEVMVEAAGEMLTEDPEQTAEASMDEMSTQEMSDDMMQEDQSTEAETVLPTAEEPDELSNQAEMATVPPPAIITQPESSDEGVLDMLPSMDKLLSDPVMLGGIGAILALLLGLVFLKRKKSGKEEGITIDDSDDLLDDDATPIHVPSTTEVSSDDDKITDEDADLVTTSVQETEVGMVETVVSEVDDSGEEDDFLATAVLSTEEKTDIIEPVVEQDDVLNEVDVYLAYGLYDNAEGLLTESLQNSPDRADYRAKLLDTHFATKNKDAFVKEAEVLKTLGGAADRFWDRVQIMGFELAPENELFSGAKESNVSVEDLQYAKPETADFDIGTDKDVTDFSNTDFDLGDDSFEVASTQVLDLPEDEFSETRDLDALDIDFPDLDDISELGAEDESDSEDMVADVSIEADDELLEELDENLDISDEVVAEDLEVDIELESEDDLSFDLPDEMDSSSESEFIELDPTVEAPAVLNEVPEMDEDGQEMDLDDSDQNVVEDNDLTSETLVVSPGDFVIDDSSEESVNDESDVLGAEISLDEGLDFDMSDMDDADLQTGGFSPSDTVALSPVDLKDDDITEFKPANATGEFDAFIAEATDEDAIAEVDATAGLDSTGTFAPGDFNEEDIAELIDVDDIGSIEDLMLPDDVDEVGTKLDLAKAFIDMGDTEGARSSLEEVLTEGTDEQKAEATGLLDQIK